MAAPTALCAPCVNLLHELCKLGDGNADLCQTFEGYITTGDDSFVERAAMLAPPGSDLRTRAVANLTAKGILPPQGA